jgi:hypothetical protein
MGKRCRQLELDLKPPPRWGGARVGAGRRPGPRPRLNHRRRPPIRSGHPCHVTLRVLAGVPSLRSRKFVRGFWRSMRLACDRGSFRVVHFSLMRNHAHFIVEAHDAWALARGMMAIGARLARLVHRAFHRRGRVASDRYHARPLATPREVRNAIAYVLLNERKHLAERGSAFLRAVRAPDPASSGVWFDGWGDPASWRAPPGIPSVAAPASWLLRVGWRRHGLIRLAEIPGVPWSLVLRG